MMSNIKNIALVFFVCCLTANAQTLTIPFREVREIELDVPPDAKYLMVDAYFKALPKKYGSRSCVITLDDHVLGTREFVGVNDVKPLRHADKISAPRINEETSTITFPYAPQSDGMSHYDFNLRPEYDKWVPVFDNFPQTIAYRVSDLLPSGSKKATVKFFNNISGPDRDYEPPLIVNQVAFSKTLPAPRQETTYFPPSWYYLAHNPEAGKEALAKLENPQTSKTVKSQLCWAFGLLNQIEGKKQNAIKYYEKALAFSEDFPEKNEVIFRLEQMGRPQTKASLETLNKNGKKWGDFIKVARKARNGEKAPRIFDIPYYAGPFKPDGKADEAIWKDSNLPWYPISHVVKGDIPDLRANQFAIFYNDEALMMIYKGPGSEKVMLRNIPGEAKPVWEFNCVEWFITPDAAFTSLYELNVSSTNGRWGIRLLWNGVTDDTFKGGWKSSASITPKQMLVEYKIPWSVFDKPSAPKNGDLWAANVVKVQHLIDKSGKDTDGEASAGELLFRHFHRPQDGFLMRFRPADVKQ